MRITLKLLSEGLRKQITSDYKNDPVKAYESIKNLYGDAQSTSSTLTTLWTKLLNSSLHTNGRFGEFQRTFDKSANDLGISDESKAAILAIQTSQKHNFQLQLLPDRLINEIKTSQKLNKNYDVVWFSSTWFCHNPPWFLALTYYCYIVP